MYESQLESMVQKDNLSLVKCYLSLVLSFIPISNIISRVIYSRTTVNFGCHIGDDFVNIFVPLDI